jgi:predicted nucleic acid-binding protein
MRRFADTNILVRYLIDEPPDQAERAAHILDGGETITITDVVLAETAYTLLSFYNRPRAAVVDQLVDLLQRENIDCHRTDKRTIILALLRCRLSGRVWFADALLWAAAHSDRPSLVYTFDRHFPSEGIEVRR